ncbi:Predicted nucleic acid-binding protein, contains PIN domain [Dyadobacter soli]|uniref:Predicted nucleic acid-binding protein, contains PIN domain n=1 Tax=Dyadobacter soli TaxID=659014 RepID=A0A1G7K8C9_9BACT|nr:PIN domain-containing protein [Dyadobacter soli]SDF33397.1 Predicted nucleic acid-binding protein, contains PIN domain [Dyadobacter soli]
MRLFLDTNALLDHALERQTGQPLEIAYILFKARKDQIPVFISPGSLYTFVYIMSKNGIRGKALCARLEAYLSFLNISISDKSVFTKGMAAGFKDLEDAFQYATALGEHCDYLITSNVADFEPFAENIRILTPSQFVIKTLHKKPGIDF